MLITKQEKLQKDGCKFDKITGLWVSPNGFIVFPKNFFLPMMEYLHSFSHWGPDKLVDLAQRQW